MIGATRQSGAFRRAGFTLIEVIASVALVAIVLPVAMRGVSLAISAASLARRQAEATSLAQTKMSELLATNAWQGGALDGDFSPDWPAYHWTGTVTEYQTSGLQQLEVRVEWTNRGVDRAVALTTLIYTGGQ